VILGFILTLCRYLASLLKDPAIPVGVGCWFVLSAMNLARSIQDLVELARSILVPFKGLSFLSGSRSGEACIDCRIFCVASAVSMPALIFVVLRLAIGVASLRGPRLSIVSDAGQPTVLSRATVGHE
jgi:hypothetical protein